MNSVNQALNLSKGTWPRKAFAAVLPAPAVGPLSRIGMAAAAGLALFIVLMVLAAPARATLTIEPITWDVVGLDHNRPLTSGPDLFPVGARVCSDVATSNVSVSMVWGNADATHLISRPGSQTTLVFDDIPENGCVDAYFEIQVIRSAAAFGQSRPYTIEATDASGTVSTPADRQIYIAPLVSQNRNSTTQIRYGQQADGSDWAVLGGGGTLALAVGETYFMELVTQTSTAYEEIQSFLTLSNTIFQVLSVETTYGTRTAPESRVPIPNPSLWGDGCLWSSNSDPANPNYNSCLSSGKVGGVVTTVYEIKIISGGGESVGLEALIYDRSGGSFHYNTDFSQSPGDLVTYDPADSFFSKRFIPDTVGPCNPSPCSPKTARLRFTITNPNPVEITGYNFYDLLPPGVTVASPSNASSTCGDAITTGTDGVTGRDYIDFDDGAIGANGSCMVLVDVTAASIGTYTNTSENLFIGETDTGKNATADLVVSDTAPPILICNANMTLALWSFTSTSSPSAPAPDSGNLVTASAGNGGGATFGIKSTGGNSYWYMQGISTDTTLNPGLNQYYEFVIDTTGLDSIAFTFQSMRQTHGARNLQLYYGPSGSLTPYTPTITTATTWTTHGPVTISNNLNPSGNTLFRIYGWEQGQAGSHEVYIDNVRFQGLYCTVQPPPEPTPGVLPPTITKSFSLTPIGVGHQSTLSFTITNPNASQQLTGIQFRDELPFGVSVVPGSFNKGACLATSVWKTNPDNSSELIHTGGILDANTSCTLSVVVTSSTVGLSKNISDPIYAIESGYNNNLTTADLRVLASPIIAKDFDPDLVLLDGVPPDDVSTLTFTITNPNPDNGIAGVAFSDTLPAGLIVANPTNAATSGFVGSPTWSPAAGDTLLNFSGGEIAAGGTGTVTVNVTGPKGAYNNVSSAVSHTVNGFSATNGNTASAALVIDDPIPGVSILKQVGLNNSYDPIAEEYPGPWFTNMVVAPGTAIYYLIIVENTGEVPLSSVKVEDPPGPAPPAVEICSWVDPLPVASAVNNDHIVYCIVSSTAAEGGPFVNVAKATGVYNSTNYTDQSTAQYSGVYPTAVTMGNVELASISVTDFLGGINAPDLDTAGLLNLLRAWDPDAAAWLEGAGRDSLLAALAAYLDPDGDGRVVVLRWETLEERGTVGFYAERRQGGDWVKINADMLPGLIAAPMGAQYWLADPGASPNDDYQYRLIEVEARGTTREYGPFDLRVGN